jgi:hypothetical protein
VLQIVNDGKGLARDVCFEPAKIDDKAFTPLRRPVIAAGQCSIISLQELQNGAGELELNAYGEYKFNIKSELNTLLEVGGFGELHVTYLDLRDQVYDAIFIPDERYNDRFNIKSQNKRK